MDGGATIEFVPVGADDLRAVDSVLADLEAYSMQVDGVPKRADAALAFVKSLPPGCEPRQKHAFLARSGGLAVGLLDIIDGYPATGTAFIGLLTIRGSTQGKGLGRAHYEAAEAFVRDELHASRLRLAVVQTNPVMGFWTRVGFRATGEIKAYQGERVATSSAALMEKAL